MTDSPYPAYDRQDPRTGAAQPLPASAWRGGMTRRDALAALAIAVGGLALAGGTRWGRRLYLGRLRAAERRERRPLLADRHPAPRPDITAAHVLPPARLGDDPEVQRAYAVARELPAVLDGIWCGCACTKSMGHRSLLACFESEQAIGCRSCREQVFLVERLHREGRPLDEIRVAVDDEYA